MTRPPPKPDRGAVLRWWPDGRLPSPFCELTARALKSLGRSARGRPAR